MSGIHEVRGAIHGKNYVLVRPLLEGTGAVFEARHDRNAGTFVVRLFPTEIRSRSETSLRIQAGARMSSLLRHTGIAQVLDFNVTGEEPTFVVTEYITGRSLEDALAEDGMLPPSLAIDLVGQIVEALRAAHAMGIVHGDLHPGAIRLAKDARGKVATKLLGFGWGRELRASGRRSGGWTYVAPEQLAPGAQRIDERADQFSLAAIAYEMLAGCSPFSEESTDLADPEARRYRLPPPLAQMVLGLPAGLDEVLRRALSYDPQERFPRLQDFASALQRVANGTTAAIAGGTRVTWEWPAPTSLSTNAVPTEIAPTPPPLFTEQDSKAEAFSNDSARSTHTEASLYPESLQADPVGLAAKDEDSDGVPVPLPQAAESSTATEEKFEGDAATTGQATLSLESDEESEASAATATETKRDGERTPIPGETAMTASPEDSVLTPPLLQTLAPILPSDIARSDVAQTPVPIEAAATVRSEAGDQTPSPFENPGIIPPNDHEQTHWAVDATTVPPEEDGSRTPIPLYPFITPSADDAVQTPVPLAAMAGASPKDGEGKDGKESSAVEDSALAWIMSERPRMTDEAHGIVFSRGDDQAAQPFDAAADATNMVRDRVSGRTPIASDSTSGVILAGGPAWDVSGATGSTLSPLLHPVVAKPRTLTRVLFVAATLAVVLGAVSVMSGMREKIPAGAAGTDRIDPQAHSTSAPHRPTAVNAGHMPTELGVTRTVKVEPAPNEPAKVSTGPVVVPTAAQATADIRNERTRPLRGHSRHASRAGGRRDHRAR